MSERCSWGTDVNLAVVGYPVGPIDVETLERGVVELHHHLLDRLVLTPGERAELVEVTSEHLRAAGGRVDSVDVAADGGPRLTVTFRRFDGETYQVTREMRAYRRLQRAS